ncbi:hypothetical protein ABZ079_27140 [Streptomyces sp. NPDC006314]|uniref:hypothetical protein n=1 Tax=Streptomyces sp. NPDC006314 TaxID=3154475 RepID=UPI0033A823B2
MLVLTYRDGELIPGDRRAMMGDLIARRDLETGYPADGHESIPTTLGADATRLAAVIRQILAQALQGVAVFPLLVGCDLTASGSGRGRILSFDAAGGRDEKRRSHAEDSGSPPVGPGPAKKQFRPGLDRRTFPSSPSSPRTDSSGRRRRRRNSAARRSGSAPAARTAAGDALTVHGRLPLGFPSPWGSPAAAFTARELLEQGDGVRL